MVPHQTQSLADAADQVEWQVLPEWNELLLGPHGLLLDKWLGQGNARVVKRGAGRTIYRVDLPQHAFFLKHQRCPGVLTALKQWFRASACRREYNKAQELSRRRVPAVTPVALGERLQGGLVRDSFLVTQAIPHACSLEEYVEGHLPRLAPSEQAGARRGLALALARLCAAAHRAGVFHDDLHGGNILLQADTSHGANNDQRLPQLFLVDLPGVRFSGPLGWRRSRRSLAMLAAGFMHRTTRTDRWRFWRAYLDQRPELKPADLRQAAQQIAVSSRKHSRRIARGRDKRSLSNNRDFYTLAGTARVGHAVADLPAAEFARWLDDPRRLIQANQHRTVKQTENSLLVRARLQLRQGPVDVALRHFFAPRRTGWLKRLLFAPRRCPARRAWYFGHALFERGIATPRPLAVCLPGRGEPSQDGYLATEWVDGAADLHRFAEGATTGDRRRLRRRLRQSATSLGRLLGRLHAAGFSHRRLSGKCLLLVTGAEDTTAYLADAEGVQRHQRLSLATRCANLAALAADLQVYPWIGRTDRLRFLRAYQRELGAGDATWKQLWRRLARSAGR